MFLRVSHKVFYGENSKMRFLWHRNNRKIDQIAFCDRDTLNLNPAIGYLHTNIIIPLLCQYELFIRTCVSKNAIVSTDTISYLL